MICFLSNNLVLGDYSYRRELPMNVKVLNIQL